MLRIVKENNLPASKIKIQPAVMSAVSEVITSEIRFVHQNVKSRKAPGKRWHSNRPFE